MILKSNFVFGHNIVATISGLSITLLKINHFERAVVNEFRHGVSNGRVFLLIDFVGMPLLSDVVYFPDCVDFFGEQVLLFRHFQNQFAHIHGTLCQILDSKDRPIGSLIDAFNYLVPSENYEALQAVISSKFAVQFLCLLLFWVVGIHGFN